MLKRQSIITEDPVYMNKSSAASLPPKPKSIFDTDEEKSKVKYLKILFHKEKNFDFFFS